MSYGTESRIKDLLDFSSVIYLEDITRENFLKLIQQFPEHQFEREPNGWVTLMPPAYGGAGSREAKIGWRVANWCDETDLGEVFGSSVGIDLPSGAIKSPDVAGYLMQP